MERLLQYVWKYKLYDPTNLVTTDGKQISVIDPGIQNNDAGPDFFNAKIRVEDTCWAGSIEVHTKASDWYSHKHHQDKAYDTVILHVVGISDRLITRMNGESIPQIQLSVPEKIKQGFEWLLFRDRPVPCLDYIPTIDSFHISMWLDRLLSERLQRKTEDIFRLLQLYRMDWNQVFYIILTRNFGFGINSDAFEQLARSLPFQYLLKHRNDILQLEALFFGQAGFLEDYIPDEYFQSLRREYGFLKHKFDLSCPENSFYKMLRTRPGNFPHVKLAQLAAIWQQHDSLFSEILHSPDIHSMKKFFRVKPSSFWQTHYHFRNVSPEKDKLLSEFSLNILLINTVVPILFAYGCQTDKPEYGERAISILEELPAEANHIINLYAKAGIPPRHAADSQALIQLKREYCEKKKCLYCQIGFRLLKRVKDHKMS